MRLKLQIIYFRTLKQRLSKNGYITTEKLQDESDKLLLMSRETENSLFSIRKTNKLLFDGDKLQTLADLKSSFDVI